jgi:hypothetical protein
LSDYLESFLKGESIPLGDNKGYLVEAGEFERRI